MWSTCLDRAAFLRPHNRQRSEDLSSAQVHYVVDYDAQNHVWCRTSTIGMVALHVSNATGKTPEMLLCVVRPRGLGCLEQRNV
jgi:hypothetical protein